MRHIPADALTHVASFLRAGLDLGRAWHSSGALTGLIFVALSFDFDQIISDEG